MKTSFKPTGVITYCSDCGLPIEGGFTVDLIGNWHHNHYLHCIDALRKKIDELKSKIGELEKTVLEKDNEK